MTRRRPPAPKPVEVQSVEVEAGPAPILFPAESQENALAILREMKQAEAKMKSLEHQANLIINATAVALNVPSGWRLDMRGEFWLFVPPPAESEILEIAQNAQD